MALHVPSYAPHPAGHKSPLHHHVASKGEPAWLYEFPMVYVFLFSGILHPHHCTLSEPVDKLSCALILWQLCAYSFIFTELIHISIPSTLKSLLLQWCYPLAFWTVYTGSPCYFHLENGIKSELAVAARTWYIYWHASQLAGERTVVNTSDNSPYTGTLACIMSDPGCCRMALDLQLTKSMMPLADSSAPEMGMLPCLRCLMTHGGWGASARHGVDG
jgi:hypothetical protein